MTATIQMLSTPDGPFMILADSDRRVLASGWTDDVARILGRLAFPPTEIVEGETVAADAVRAYYAGDLAAIDGVAVVQTGTPFRLAGWAQLRCIEPGSPLTYAEFAARLGRPTAVRAAASVCAANAPALFVPCHRVLRADGSMGGFAWGTDIKASLLARESSTRHPAPWKHDRAG